MRFSDPYKAISYDKLHVDDLGRFGDHLWGLIVDVLKVYGLLGLLNQKCV
jgi:hypothetical protein